MKGLQEMGAGMIWRPMKGMARLLSRFANSPGSRFLSWHPDVVCISQGGTYDCMNSKQFSRLPGLLSKRGIPYVIVCHGNIEMDIPSDAQRTRAVAFFLGADRLVFVADRMRMLAERQLAQALPNAVVLRNPLNLKTFSAVPWPVGKSMRFAIVGRLDAAIKGHDVLFESLAGEPWRHRDWRLRVVGDGPSATYLRCLSAFYGIESRVDFLGHVEDIRAVWADNHLAVIASRTEGLPLTLEESMLCSRPALVTDVGAITEWVREPISGFVAEGANPRVLAAAFERAWAARSVWSEIGSRARALALSKYDPAPCEKLLGLLEEARARG